MRRLRLFYQSTPGQKAVAALTGVVLFLFLAMHMAGNLKAFLAPHDGAPAIDHYGRFLRTAGEPLLPHGTLLWVTRIVLLACFVLHIWTVMQLTRRNRAARPLPYLGGAPGNASFAARSMLGTGIFVGAFVVFHVLHFTTGSIRIGEFEHGQVYANLYHSFGFALAALFYVAAMIVLAVHLYHGVWSLFQSLGLDNPDRNAGLRGFAVAAAVLIAVGFMAVPICFLLGVLPEPPAPHALMGGK